MHGFTALIKGNHEQVCQALDKLDRCELATFTSEWSDACVVQFEAALDEMVAWFCDGGHGAPFPPGTLLHYRTWESFSYSRED